MVCATPAKLTRLGRPQHGLFRCDDVFEVVKRITGQLAGYTTQTIGGREVFWPNQMPQAISLRGSDRHKFGWQPFPPFLLPVAQRSKLFINPNRRLQLSP
jgi:hypothetical protein